MKNLTYILSFLFIIGCGRFSEKTKDSSLDWSFRGGSSLGGYTAVKLPDELTLLWSYKSDSRTASSPVISRGVAYWSDKRGKIRGVNPQGELCFEYDLATAVESTPLVNDSTLYIGRIDGFLSAISLITKDTLWNFETLGQISATPNMVTTSDGRKAILVGSYDNYMYTIDAQTGRQRGRIESGYYINGAVAAFDGYATFGGCDGWLRVVEVERGVVTDSVEVEAYIPNSPAVQGGHLYVGDYVGNLYDISFLKGKIDNFGKIVESKSKNSALVSVPAISKDMVYLLSDDRYLYAIDRRTGEQRWKFMLGGDLGESSPVVCDKKVVVCSKSGLVTIVDARSGELIWEYDTGEQITASPAVIGSGLYILTTKGTLFCFG